MFIEVTDREDRKILVNLNYITEIKTLDVGKEANTILFHLKGMYEVKESFEEVKRLIIDKGLTI